MNDRHIYRAWSKKHKQMWGVAELSWVVEHNYDEPERDISSEVQEIGACKYPTPAIDKIGGNPIKDVILMQSTGLKDKNGNLIFEGDIIMGLGVVQWYEKDAKYMLYFDGKKPTIELLAAKYSEVIGNKMENGDLLK